MFRIIMCVPHLYAGVFPCPWPGCSNGTSDKKITLSGVEVFRSLFCEDMRPTYVWVFAGKPAEHCISKIVASELADVNGLPLTSAGSDGHLYHFSSAAGIAAILQSDELWLTDYRDLADTTELIHGRSFAKTAFDHVSDSMDPDARSILETTIDAPLEGSVFVGCFSMLKSSELHWKNYAQNGDGAAIGFEIPGFHELIAVDPFAIKVGRVVYWDVLKENLFLLLSKALDDVIRFDRSRNVFDANAYARELSRLVPELFSFCKARQYEDESEVRLVVSPADAVRLGPLRPRSRTIGDRKIRYVSTRDLDPTFELPILHAVIGPSASQSSAETVVAAVTKRGVPVLR